MSAFGKIISIDNNNAGVMVHVEIPNTKVGPLNLRILVDGPIVSAPEQARKKLRDLASELALGFDAYGSLI